MPIYIERPSIVSEQYAQEFEIKRFLENLIHAHGFSSKIRFIEAEISFRIYIWFPKAGQEGKYTDPKAGDTIFDKSFQKKPVANIKKEMLRS